MLKDQCWARFAEDVVPDHAGTAPDQTAVLAIVVEVLKRCEVLLPRPGTLSVVLLSEGDHDEYSSFVRAQMYGVSGLTPGASLVALRIGQEPGWQNALADAVAHEYHHAAWVALRPDIDRSVDLSLADQLVFEGRACLYARAVTGGWIAPWTTPLDDVQFEAQVRTALMENAPFTPGPDAPFWWVYRLGHSWVEAELSHRLCNWTVWTRLDARALLNLG